jgi:hypothetical protein
MWFSKNKWMRKDMRVVYGQTTEGMKKRKRSGQTNSCGGLLAA